MVRSSVPAPIISTDRSYLKLWEHLDSLNLSKHKPPYPFYIQRYVRTLYHLAEAFEIKTALEIGIGSLAMSGQSFAHSMAQRGGGRIVSVDIDVTRPNAVQHAYALTCGVEWTIIHGDSTSPEVKVPELNYDLLFIDGDHVTPAPRLDFEKYYPLVRPGGLVLFDDYKLLYDDATDKGVYNLISSLQEEGLVLFPLPTDPPQQNHIVLHRKPNQKTKG